MPPVVHAKVPIIDSERFAIGDLHIYTLPQRPTGLWDTRSESEADEALEPIQLLEGHEYRYEFSLARPTGSPLTTDRPELFISDKADGLTGRLRPGLFTGALPVRVETGESAG